MKGLYKKENDKIIFEKDEIILYNGKKINVQECTNTMIEIEGWRWFDCYEEAYMYFNPEKKQNI
ncbi:MAG: hypothetical protein PHE30_04870 [Candidatus Omnitrophica bacterium]|nr:hypothetical protein [Candidatus Omnitrophota bacterium]